MAMRARDTLFPAEWWSNYGGGCPNLTHLAIRILSQTSSLIRSKPGRIPLEEMHETKNCIEHQRLNDLAFVQYNMWLRQRKNMELDCMDAISYDKMELVHNWVSRRELSSEDMEISDWMTVNPPLGSIAPLGPLIDDIEALDAGFDDFEIFGGPKDSEEETGEDNIVNE
ncbi:hypothetical protein K7X08_023176 [Anisodus acutangulus]|uniref:HAT C-terminal dimerisation domain-containing protein n=1 Tax=Anisodus acutangulus TaxID=402998 RepID=A0A9Q1R0U1_9SOLA|nr:hypothetical protein K7X08_023176 [Anisodus acutangulus]